MHNRKANAQRFREQFTKRVVELGLTVKLWDIETGMNRQYAFDIWNGTSHKTIEKERYIICAAWQDVGKNYVSHVSVADDKRRFKKDPMDDYYVINVMYDYIAASDLLVAHYGDKFDLPMFNARAIYHGLPPLPLIPTVDTKAIASKKFRFNSNRLDALARLFGYDPKINTEVSLWLDCMRGEESAVKDMLTYNIQDIDVLFNVFCELAPYVPPKINMNLFSGDTSKPVCPVCGSTHVYGNGHRPNRTTIAHRMRCNTCGHSFIGENVRRSDGKVLRAPYR